MSTERDPLMLPWRDQTWRERCETVFCWAIADKNQEKYSDYYS